MKVFSDFYSAIKSIIGPKTDAADYTYNATTASLMALIKGILGSLVIGEGTFTTSSESVPADTSYAAKASAYYKGNLLMPLTGSCAFQTRPIVNFTTGTGVFQLASHQPFTAATGLVTYVVLSAQAANIIANANTTENYTSAQSSGNKSDNANLTKGEASIIGLLRHYGGGLAIPAIVTTYTSTTQFAATNLIGFGDDYFNGWYVYAAWDAAGASAAPQGEFQPVTDFTSSTGVVVHSAFTAALAATDKVTLIHPILYRIIALQGGTETLESIKTDIEAIFDVARDGDSGTTTMDGTEQTLLEVTPTSPQEFKGGMIDLTNLADTRAVRIRVYAKVKSGGDYIKKSDDTANTYTGAQDPDLIEITGFMNRYGYKVTAEQTVEGGGYIAIDHEWYNAASGI